MMLYLYTLFLDPHSEYKISKFGIFNFLLSCLATGTEARESNLVLLLSLEICYCYDVIWGHFTLASE